MHEHGIAQQMVNVALRHAQDHHAQRITQFRIEMNQAADESEDSLRFYLEHLTRATVAEGAQIDIDRVPNHAVCLDCGSQFEPEYVGQVCPQCSSMHVTSHQLEEFRLASIDIE